MNRKVRARLGLVLLHSTLLYLTYNSLLMIEHEVHIAHDNVEAQVQRKHDLLINAVAAVAEYRDIEKEIIKHAVEKRGKNRGMDISKPKEGLADLLLKLGILYEKYPGIKASGPYTFLMDTILDSGARVTEARQKYNRKVFEYNTYLKMFPRRFAGHIMGFHVKEFFNADEASYKVPCIKCIKEMEGI